jgi:hypothetical protein
VPGVAVASHTAWIPASVSDTDVPTVRKLCKAVNRYWFSIEIIHNKFALDLLNVSLPDS